MLAEISGGGGGVVREVAPPESWYPHPWGHNTCWLSAGGTRCRVNMINRQIIIYFTVRKSKKKKRICCCNKGSVYIYIFYRKGPSTLATLFSHRWPRFCGGVIYSRRKPLYSRFGEHTAVCGSSVRQAVARPRHRQSVFVAAFCVRQRAH